MIYRAKFCRQNSGVILVTVLAILVVMSVFVVATLSQNLNQAASAQTQLDEIKARELVMGAFWKAYADMNDGINNPSVPSENLDGKTFTVSVDPRPASSTVPYRVIVN
ncbi:MAG: hypothetical protein HY591_04580, partial [Candidatus Omnitrophica bacterium]|nr:hypothetical protein [Candidatus Omnitrophota bacterium]